MFGLSLGEIMILTVLVVLLFGTKKLPALGSALANSIKNFQKGMASKNDEDTTH